MKQLKLYLLTPRPLPVETPLLKGELSIEGSVESNVIRLCFHFDTSCQICPLAVTVRAAGQDFRYYLIIRDENAATVKTPVFHSEFYVGQRFDVMVVEPLAQFFPDSANKQGIFDSSTIKEKSV
jgi:hypothetical protein